jgi:hypothetical protein
MNGTTINLADAAAYRRLPGKTREELGRWVVDLLGSDKRAEAYTAMLYASFIFQRLSLDWLERAMAEAPEPAGAMAGMRMEALRHLFQSMRLEAEQPTTPDRLIATCGAIIDELTRLKVGRASRRSLGLDPRRLPWPRLGKRLDRPGGFALLYGDLDVVHHCLVDIAIWAGMSRTPMYLFAAGDPFDRPFLAQGFPNVTAFPLEEWEGAAVDGDKWEKLTRRMPLAGLVLITRFASFLPRANVRPSALRHRLRRLLRPLGVTAVGCLDERYGERMFGVRADGGASPALPGDVCRVALAEPGEPPGEEALGGRELRLTVAVPPGEEEEVKLVAP